MLSNVTMAFAVAVLLAPIVLAVRLMRKATRTAERDRIDAAQRTTRLREPGR